MSWTPDDVERWLNDYPLPKDFVFNGERVWPRYRLKKGYGFWLRTAGPYHKPLRGLFALCCKILIGLPAGATLPTPEQLADLVTMQPRDDMPLFPEDTAEPEAFNPAGEFGARVDDASPTREQRYDDDAFTPPFG